MANPSTLNSFEYLMKKLYSNESLVSAMRNSSKRLDFSLVKTSPFPQIPKLDGLHAVSTPPENMDSNESTSPPSARQPAASTPAGRMRWTISSEAPLAYSQAYRVVLDEALALREYRAPSRPVQTRPSENALGKEEL